MIDLIIEWLISRDVPAGTARALTLGTGVLLVGFLAWLANLVTKGIILRAVKYLVARTSSSWDDTFVERNVFGRLSHLAPAIVIYLTLPLVIGAYPTATAVAVKLTQIYMIAVGLLAINGLLSAADDIYKTFDASKQIPLTSFIQVTKVALWCIGGIVVVAIVVDKTPLYLLSGLGALTAVLMIVFKDPILGFVAGVQLSANQMVAIGDWVEMPSHKADGNVIEVALTTVKVRNWDKTITTLPTYDLISRPFKNWKGMSETGGRRIRRNLYVDQNTVRFMDEEALARASSIQLLQGYLEAKQAEVATHNEEQQVDPCSLVNGRRLTNVGTFRAYIEAYLRAHPRIRKDLTLLVRQRDPGPHGLPIQLYAFTDTTAWAEYEGIQSDIFDHVLAVLPEFGLRVFQDPTGMDWREHG
jgi:miniconductance mechanosensitive channel